MDDLSIICKQTGLELEKAKELYTKNQEDIVATICEIEGFVEQQPNLEPKLTEEQQKIKELREIVNRKDEILDKLIKKDV